MLLINFVLLEPKKKNCNNLALSLYFSHPYAPHRIKPLHLIFKKYAPHHTSFWS